MTDRFSPRHIWVAHRKGLKNRVYSSSRPAGRVDRVAVCLLYGLPLVAGVLSYVLDLRIVKPEAMLTAFGVLLGGLLMAFTQIAAWRDRFTQRLDDSRITEVHQRDSLDEAVAHILMAFYGSTLLFTLIVAGTNFLDDKERLHSWWAVLANVLGTYVFLLLLLIAPKLYTAYAVVNKVDDEMSGLSH